MVKKKATRRKWRGGKRENNAARQKRKMYGMTPIHGSMFDVHSPQKKVSDAPHYLVVAYIIGMAFVSFGMVGMLCYSFGGECRI